MLIVFKFLSFTLWVVGRAKKFEINKKLSTTFSCVLHALVAYRMHAWCTYYMYIIGLASRKLKLSLT